MLLETLSISQQVWCQDWDTRVELAGVVCSRVTSNGGAQVVVYNGNLIPLLDQEVYGGLERPAVGIQKRQKKKKSQERKKKERWDAEDKWGRASVPTYQQSRPQLPARPALSPYSQISICARNELASGPCGQSRGRPVIKMKWAVHPMVPFRRLEHWPWDLYLIDQPVQEKTSFTPERPVPDSTAQCWRTTLYKKKKW